MEAIRRAYHRTDRKVLKTKKEARDDDVDGSSTRRCGGSTAVMVILVNGETLVVVNVGDTRAVECERGKARQLSVDHEPLRQRRAIESRGGFVTEIHGDVPRVDAQLSMSRAFGDRPIKEQISSDPDVAIEDVGGDGTELVVLASDGLWEVMSNQGAANEVRGTTEAREAAVRLVDEALHRGSKDDVACVVVRLH